MERTTDYKNGINDPFPKAPSRIPKSVGIQVHNSCNSKCIMCAYKDTHKKRSYERISMQDFTKIVDEFLALGVKIFSLSLQCEALHDPQIFEKIRYIKNKGASCGISTNGLLLDNKMADKLFNYGLDIISISLNAVSEETFQFVYGVKGFDNFVNNVIYVIKNKPDNLILAFNSLVIKQNYAELTEKKHELFRLLEQHNLRSRMGPIGNHCGGLANYSDLVIVPEEQSSTKKLYCHDIFESIYILSDGDIVGCCSDFRKKYIMGNIKNQKFPDIWDHQANKQRRHDMIHTNLYDLEPCKDCSQAWNIMKNRGIDKPSQN